LQNIPSPGAATNGAGFFFPGAGVVFGCYKFIAPRMRIGFGDISSAFMRRTRGGAR
jgi:hypothetical protein